MQAPAAQAASRYRLAGLPPVPLEPHGAGRDNILQAAAKAVGKHLGYTQAQAEVARRHGYANVHEMTASYPPATTLSGAARDALNKAIDAAMESGLAAAGIGAAAHNVTPQEQTTKERRLRQQLTSAGGSGAHRARRLLNEECR